MDLIGAEYRTVVTVQAAYRLNAEIPMLLYTKSFT